MSPARTRIRLPHLPVPAILSFIFAILVAVLLGSYVIFQARLLIAGPTITFSDDLEVVQSTRQINLSGNTANITSITLNDRPISTTQDGIFNESIVLENGYNVVSLKAKDRYGREIKLEREFVYSPLSLYSQ